MELKEFEVGLGQMFEDGSPVVIAVDENNNPRLLGKEKVYLKSEADKVIAELIEKNKRLARKDIIMASNAIKDVYKELRHSKYKRCLDKAKWCFTKSNYHFVLARHGENGKENNRRSILYAKWHKRWLELAKKFKEALDV